MKKENLEELERLEAAGEAIISGMTRVVGTPKERLPNESEEDYSNRIRAHSLHFMLTITPKKFIEKELEKGVPEEEAMEALRYALFEI